MTTFTYAGRAQTHDGRWIVITRPVEFTAEAIGVDDWSGFDYPAWWCVPTHIAEATTNLWLYVTDDDLVAFQGYCPECLRREPCGCDENFAMMAKHA